MAKSQALAVREKQELAPKEEKTVPSKFYVPSTDIYETDGALIVLVELPGVERKNVSVKLENEVLRVEGQIDHSKYEGLEPVYSEYNVGHFTRAFTLSSQIDQNGIGAELEDGVLKLTLKKSKEALPKKIPIQ